MIKVIYLKQNENDLLKKICELEKKPASAVIRELIVKKAEELLGWAKNS